MYTILDMIIIACGIYVLNGYYQLKTKGIIKEGLLLPKGFPATRCKDKEGYISEMSPKLLIYGITLLLCGILSYLQNLFQLFGLFYLLMLAVFLGVTIWFTKQTKKAIMKYF
jgi:uncharacterized membrane protein